MNARLADSKTPARRMFVKNGRGTEREALHCRVTYTYQAGSSTYAVDGVTRDLCRTGCGIRGSIIPPVGSKTRLKVYLGGQKLPIAVDARIAWVAGDYFGVRFAEMNSKDYTRVRRYMWSALNTTM